MIHRHAAAAAAAAVACHAVTVTEVTQRLSLAAIDHVPVRSRARRAPCAAPRATVTVMIRRTSESRSATRSLRYRAPGARRGQPGFRSSRPGARVAPRPTFLLLSKSGAAPTNPPTLRRCLARQYHNTLPTNHPFTPTPSVEVLIIVTTPIVSHGTTTLTRTTYPETIAFPNRPTPHQFQPRIEREPQSLQYPLNM
eukprot:745620-Hanusia_phi.AAC.1